MRWPFTARRTRDPKAVFPRLRRLAIKRETMRRPEIDWERSQLVEGPLRLDLLNVFHTTGQLQNKDHERALQAWLEPADLRQARYYARVDVVRARLAEGASPDGIPHRGSPIGAAKEAWVTTPLHVECVRALLDAGARLTPLSFGLDPEAVGSETDFVLLDLLVEFGIEHRDPSVRAAAKGANIDGYREVFRQMRARR